jgi:hypothetical protein
VCHAAKRSSFFETGSFERKIVVVVLPDLIYLTLFKDHPYLNHERTVELALDMYNIAVASQRELLRVFRKARVIISVRHDWNEQVKEDTIKSRTFCPLACFQKM